MRRTTPALVTVLALLLAAGLGACTDSTENTEPKAAADLPAAPTRPENSFS